MLVREFNRIVPTGATRYADKLSDAVAYIFANKSGQPAAQIFYGKQSKPVAFYRFKDDAQRAKLVADYFERRRTWQQNKASDQAKRAAETPSYNVGDILVSSWGYSMTLVDFYQVVAVKGKRVTIRQIHSEVVVPDGRGDGRVTAVKDSFKGEPVTKLGQAGGIKVADGRYARRWDGKPQYFNTYD